MEKDKEYQYYVVEFKDRPPTEDVRYVCILDSWMVSRDVENQTGTIKYPKEVLSSTKNRVRKNEDYSNVWSVFEVDVKFGTNNYKRAKHYIKELNDALYREKYLAEIEKKANQPSTSGLKTRASGVNYKVNQPTTSEALTNGDSSTEKITPQPSTSKTFPNCNQESAIIEALSKQLLLVLNLNNDMEDANRYFSRQASQLQSLYTSMTFRDNPNNESKIINETPVGQVKNNESTIGKGRLKRIFNDEVISFLKEMEGVFNVQCNVMENILSKLKTHSAQLKNMIALIENYNKMCIDTVTQIVATKTNEKNKSGDIVNGIIKVADVEVAQSENKNDDDADSHRDVGDGYDNFDGDNVGRQHGFDDKSKDRNDKHLPLKKRGIPRTFTLPPESDKNDSKWTLRYQKKAKGLVELMPHSNVYVDALKLSNSLRLSKDCTTLARMLLVEVFKEKALYTCSLTGKQNNGIIKPGLDDNAKNVILNFVKDHAIKNRWIMLDTPTISTSLRNKLREIRIKHEKIRDS